MNPDGPFESAAGEGAASLTELLQKYRPRLLAMLQRRIDPALAGRFDAEDILSRAEEKAYRKWPAFREQPDRLPYPWLYRIVRDCLIAAWRHETRGRRNPERELPWPEQSSVQLGLGLVSPGTSPSEAAAREEMRQRMQQTLAQLRDEDREILWMRHYDQLTIKEIAAVLGVPAPTAAQRLVGLDRSNATYSWQRV